MQARPKNRAELRSNLRGWRGGDIEASSFDLRLTLQEVDEMLAPKIEDRKLDLVLQYPAEVPCRFAGDAGRIRQVMTNLVGNAIKSTPVGNIVIEV